jgi:hypothetical protein
MSDAQFHPDSLGAVQALAASQCDLGARCFEAPYVMAVASAPASIWTGPPA